MSEMQKVRRQRRGRARSEETEQLVEAIMSLNAGQAKAVELDAGEDARKIRSKLNYASRVAGRKLRIVIEDHRVLFARGRARRTTQS